MTVDYKKKYGEQLQAIKENYKAFDQPYNGKDNDDYVNGQGFCCNDGTPEAAQLVLWHAQRLQTVTIGGVAGYFTGRTVSETVYDRIT